MAKKLSEYHINHGYMQTDLNGSMFNEISALCNCDNIFQVTIKISKLSKHSFVMAC